MTYRGGVVGCVVFAVVASTATPAGASSAQTPVVIRGVGAAHGFGMAMDGVEGQARAGWTHDRILSLFYPGTSTGRAGGTIRVGLAEVDAVSLGVPAGGGVSDAPRGAGGSAGFPVTLPAGTRVSLRATDGGVAIVGGVKLPAAPEASAASRRKREPSHTAQQEEPEPPTVLPTPPPAPSAPPLEPTPTPPPSNKVRPAPERKPVNGDAPSRIAKSVWVWGVGDPALVSVDATGRRYRGVMEVKSLRGKLVVVNHVDLETYVRGIAEEKGQAWPIEGLKALAIAARSLGAATMSWYSKNTANGYDICPNANCQLYLGHDGEEAAMTQAVAATAGQIRTYNGRPIMAMYHGNGGGQTESYKAAIGGGSDPHPYLSSVKYPFADPSKWGKKTTLGAIDTAVRAGEIGVPGALRGIEVTKRGVSPRVLRVRLSGTDGDVEVSGTQFATALGLRSTWFDFGTPDDPESFATSEVFAAQDIAGVPVGREAVERGTGWALPALLAIGCLASIAAAAGLRAGGAVPAVDPLRGVAARLRGRRLRLPFAARRSRFRRLSE